MSVPTSWPPVPQSVPAHRLAAVAAWDVPQLRRAVAALAEGTERLPCWRLRVEALGRALEAAECWSGPAADSAAAAVLELSVVATAVQAALGKSAAACAELVGEAGAAQHLAADALALAATLPDDLDAAVGAHRSFAAAVRALGPGAAEPAADQAVALAEDALAHAAAAAAAAAAARRAVHGPAGTRGPVPVGFDDLLEVASVPVPIGPGAVPVGQGPVDVAAWWVSLSAAAQLAVVRRVPMVIGALDGVPAWARDRANRLVLARAIDASGTPAYQRATARMVAAAVATEEAAGRPVQLHLLDLRGDRVALAFGDLDTADDVALLVPGVGNSPGDDLDRLAGDARDLQDAASAVAPGQAVAAVVWLGYRTPDLLAALSRAAAHRGAPALAGALAGLAAARSAGGGPPARTTVLAHSYGTVVVDEAADEPGRLKPMPWSFSAARGWRTTRPTWRRGRCSTPRLRLIRSHGAAGSGSLRRGPATARQGCPWRRPWGPPTITPPLCRPFTPWGRWSPVPGRPTDPFAGALFRHREHRCTMRVDPAAARPRRVAVGTPSPKWLTVARQGGGTRRRPPAPGAGGRPMAPRPQAPVRRPAAVSRSIAAPPTGAPCPRRPARPEARSPA